MKDEDWVKENGGYEWTPGSPWPSPDEPSTRISRAVPIDTEVLKAVVKECVKEALQEWESGVEYLHSPTDPEGRYFCSKADCEGVRYGDYNAKEASD